MGGILVADEQGREPKVSSLQRASGKIQSPGEEKV
jgi:hypothetical protein